MSRRFLLLPVLPRRYLPSHRNYVWGLYLYTFWNAYQTKCILPNLLPVSFHWSQWRLCQNKVTYSLAAIQRPGQHVGIKSNKIFRKLYEFRPHLLMSSMNTGLSPRRLPRNPSSLVLTWRDQLLSCSFRDTDNQSAYGIQCRTSQRPLP